MQVLTRNELPLGGFAGLVEHRFVTDSRLFGSRKSPLTFEGLGQFVYLADAKFNPFGETTMHPHKEIDVITIMLDGQVTHEGSLEHGKSLQAGDAQVQRAGGEGFSHNEINPNSSTNRLLQLWVLPDTLGEPAAYKYYKTAKQGITHIYGGDKTQNATFDSKTHIYIVKLAAGESYRADTETLAYVYKGNLDVETTERQIMATDGTLVRTKHATFSALTPSEFVVINHVE